MRDFKTIITEKGTEAWQGGHLAQQFLFCPEVAKESVRLFCFERTENLNKQIMKAKISRACLISYVLFFILWAFLTVIPGGSVGWFCAMGALTIPPIIMGTRWLRILGVIALTSAIAIAVSDYNAGKDMQKLQKRLKDAQKQQEPQTDSVDKR